MTKPQAWLIEAAKRAVDYLGDRIRGVTPANWGPTDIIAVSRELASAIRAVEAQEQERRAMVLEVNVTPDSRLLTEPTTDPGLLALRSLARTVIEVCELLQHETYRDTPFTRDERALLLGTIEHAIVKLEPLSHHLIYLYRAEKEPA